LFVDTSVGLLLFVPAGRFCGREERPWCWRVEPVTIEV